MGGSDTSQSVRWGNITWSWCDEGREGSVDHRSDHTSSLGGNDTSRCDCSDDPLGRGPLEGSRNGLGRGINLRFMNLQITAPGPYTPCILGIVGDLENVESPQVTYSSAHPSIYKRHKRRTSFPGIKNNKPKRRYFILPEHKPPDSPSRPFIKFSTWWRELGSSEGRVDGLSEWSIGFEIWVEEFTC
jgi:hypothetical protein